MKWPFALLILSLPFSVQAKVTSATLFPSHAQLTWEETVSLQQGSGELTLNGLPVSMQDGTLMAELQGMPGVLIQRVQIRQVEQAGVVAQATRKLREALREVEQSIGAREDGIKAWSQQVKLMTEAAATPGEITASELALLADTVQESTLKALARIREIRQSMTDDIAERDRLKRELAATQQNARATKSITIAYRAREAGQATAQLRYQTHGASWQSRYNARLVTAKNGTEGTIILEQLASIRQTTGTDWTNVELRLSTANSRLGTDIPPLHPWIVSAAGSSMDMIRAEALVQGAPPQTAQVVNDGAFTQSYRVETPVNLASGNADQFISVANHDVPVSIETRFLPAVDLNGFVHANGTFTADISLPPGPVALYRDGQSVGASYLERVSADSKLAIGFGVNDRVTAEVVDEQNQQGEQGVFKGEKYVRRVYRYEITNNHPRSVAVRVFDRIPVSRHDDLTVEILEITQPATRNFQDMKGVISWERTIEPGTTLILKSGFELRVPEDSELPPAFQ